MEHRARILISNKERVSNQDRRELDILRKAAGFAGPTPLGIGFQLYLLGKKYKVREIK